MLATHRQPLPVAAAIEGQKHTIECPECGGSGRYIVEFDGGQEQRDRGPCSECEGKKTIAAVVHPEDCRCESCVFGFWFFPAPIGEHPARRYDMLKDALRAGEGEITKRDRVSGIHTLIAVLG